jgi:hypothetical protein
MKIIFAGPRDYTDYDIAMTAIFGALKEWDLSLQEISIVSGEAPGADALGERFSKEFLNKKATCFPANWAKYDGAAGPIRNAQMANYADALVCVWDGKSKGTGDMIKKALAKNLKIYIHRFDLI